MNKNELLRFAVTQNQFIKGYDEKNSKECYNKVLNSYRQLYDRVVNYCVLSEEMPQELLQITPVINYEAPKKKTSQGELNINSFKKQGHKDNIKLQTWRAYRDQKVIELFNECVRKQQPITDDIIFRIAQIVGSTRPKVKKIIEEYTSE